MAIITASVTIGFQTPDSGSASFSAEIDGRPTGQNAGKTSFAPGDPVGMLVYKTSTVGNVTATPSSGQVAMGGFVDVTVEEDFTMANSDNFSVSKPVKAGTTPTFTWFGTAPSGLVKTTETTFKCTKPAITAGKIKYTSSAQTAILSNVALAYSAAVVVFFADDGKV